MRQVAVEQANLNRSNQNNNTIDTNNTTEETLVQITLPYAGKQGEVILKEINKHMKKVKPKVKARVSYTAKRLGSVFGIKDKTQKCHEHNIVYSVKCPDCDDTYIGESGRRLDERITEHSGKDKTSHIFSCDWAPTSNIK